MNCIIPFESKLKFDGPIKEICTISLEHEITKNEKEILGNFIISGTYKEHELSVNTLPFSFTVPFEVELERNIVLDTLDFNIDNFTYDTSGDEMNVYIDYVVYADEQKEDINEEKEEERLEEDPLDLIDESFTEEKAGEEIHEERHEDNQDEYQEITPIENNNTLNPFNLYDDYISFKIHIVKEEDTIESICLNNNISKDDFLLVNGIDNITMGEKVIIPLNNEA